MAVSTSSNNALCVADSSGDVILVVGGGVNPNNTLSVQVSSHVLGLVSSVFKAIFSSHYHEGAILKATAGQPVTIQLPDDDPEAVSLACRMFHYKVDDSLEQPSLELLANLAMFCDKYDCARAVRPSTRLWIRPYYHLGGVTGFHNLLLVSYMLDDSAFFDEVTRGLVCRYTGNYMDFVSAHGRNILPSCLCLALEEKRKNVNNRIMDAVKELIKPLMFGHEASIALYHQEFYRVGVFPLRPTTSLESTIASLKTYDASILSTLHCPCRNCLKVGNISEKVREIGAQVRDW